MSHGHGQIPLRPPNSRWTISLVHWRTWSKEGLQVSDDKGDIPYIVRLTTDVEARQICDEEETTGPAQPIEVTNLCHVIRLHFGE